MALTAEDSFGARLRRERERRQIALSSISANSKISVALFEALEREDVSRWPTGIYRRAFIRAYAEGVGLDVDAVTREFLARFPDPADPQPAEIADANGSMPPSRAVARSGEHVIRLTLADPPSAFTGGRLLARMKRRLAAAGWDGGVVVAISSVIFLVFGRFWAPLGVTTLAYYLGGILVLGNTPGVCLLAPPANSTADESGDPSGGLAVKYRQKMAQLAARAKRGPVGWRGAETRV
jgi:hypothetical protein